MKEHCKTPYYYGSSLGLAPPPSRCECRARLCPDIICILGATPTIKPPFSPNPNLIVQLSEFTYINDRFPLKARTRKLDKHAILLPLLIEWGWQVLPPVIITLGICGTIHTPTTKSLTNLKFPTIFFHKLMDTLLQISILRYSTHIRVIL